MCSCAVVQSRLVSNNVCYKDALAIFHEMICLACWPRIKGLMHRHACLLHVWHELFKSHSCCCKGFAEASIVPYSCREFGMSARRSHVTLYKPGNHDNEQAARRIRNFRMIRLKWLVKAMYWLPGYETQCLEVLPNRASCPSGLDLLRLA